MKFKWTFLSAVLLAILISFLYFWDRIEEKKKEEELRAKVVFPFNPERLDGITIKSGKGNISLLKGNDGGWELEEPVKAKADFKIVSGLITKLKELHFIKSFDASQKDLSSYGLFPPKAEVNLREGNNKTTFLLGEETPTANSVYLKKSNENKILLVDTAISRVLLRDVFDFRDKTVISFDRNNVNKVELIYPEKTFTLLRDGQNWQITNPIKAKAGAEEIRKIFDSLLELSVQRFEKEGISDDKAYNFNKPQLKVILDFDNGESESLIFGKSTEEGVFAKIESKKAVYVVSEAIAEKLPKDSFDLRNKKLAPFYRDEIEFITLTSKEKTIEIERDLNDQWKIVKPINVKGDTIEIESLIYNIINLSFIEFIDNLSKDLRSIGINPPEKEIIIRGKNKKHLVTIKIGKTNPDKFLNYAINDLENKLGMIDYTFVRDYLNLDVEKLKQK